MVALRVLILAAALLPSWVRAETVAQGWAEQQSAQCSVAIVAAEARHATAPGLLSAIARAESGRPVPPLAGLQPWPWAINADGAARYFDSKAAAVAWTNQALTRGVRQIDVGCMQINLQSHPQAFRSIDDAFDPAQNADYAARFLVRLREDAGGNWFVATGYYHSRTPVLAADYRERVQAIAEGRIPAVGLGVPLYLRAIRQGTLRIALAGGGTLRLNIRRQPSLRGPRRLSACQVAGVLGDYMAAPARAGCARGIGGRACRRYSKQTAKQSVAKQSVVRLARLLENGYGTAKSAASKDLAGLALFIRLHRVPVHTPFETLP